MRGFLFSCALNDTTVLTGSTFKLANDRGNNYVVFTEIMRVRHPVALTEKQTIHVGY
jgi:hypothetical protein